MRDLLVSAVSISTYDIIQQELLCWMLVQLKIVYVIGVIRRVGKRK